MVTKHASIKGNVSSIKGNVSSTKGNVSSTKGNVSSTKGNVSSTKGNALFHMKTCNNFYENTIKALFRPKYLGVYKLCLYSFLN